MDKKEKLERKYFETLKKKNEADRVFYKAMNKYFEYLHGEKLGSAVAYASTLNW